MYRVTIGAVLGLDKTKVPRLVALINKPKLAAAELIVNLD